MPLSFQTRSTQTEIIDDFSLSGNEVAATFDSIEGINTWLGGNAVLKSGLAKILKSEEWQGKEIRFWDLGCGTGDGLRALAKWAKRKSKKLTFKGLDANAFVVQLARERNQHFQSIQFEQGDVLAPDFTVQADIVACSLFLHHFTEVEIQRLLQSCKRQGVKVLLINDLHRSVLAYRLFQLVAFVFRLPQMAKIDGLISIQKGFRRKELIAMAESLNAQRYTLQWKWAFRYELIVWL